MKSFVRRNHIGVFAAVLAALIVLAMALGGFIASRGSSLVAEETSRYLSEVSQQTAFKVNQRIEFNLGLLQNIDRQLEIMRTDDASREAAIGAVVESSPFVWIGYADAAGNLTVPGKGLADASACSAVMQAIAGGPAVSDELVSLFEGETGALYAVPAPGDNGASAIVGCVTPEKMELLRDTDTFDGVGYSHIVSRTVDFILRADNPHSLLGGDNVFDTLREKTDLSEDDLEDMGRNLLRGAGGRVSFSVDGELREMHYRPLDAGGWYVLSIVPPQAYTGSLTDFIAFALAAMAALCVVSFAVFGTYLLWVTGKKNREVGRIAFVDPVTGGHTAARFDQLVGERQEKGVPFTLVSLDIGNFRLLNDLYGKADGDRLLRLVHQVLSEGLHEGEVVARIAADTFNLALDDLDADAVDARLGRFAERVNSFNAESEVTYVVRISCGAYVVEPDADIVVARDRANTARKSADSSRDRLCSCAFFSGVEHERLLREKDMENAMERALAEGEFVAYLQPKVSLRTDEVVGAEALVRWESPRRGLVQPDDFIPFFERNGFVVKVDLAVFEQVCARIRSWIDRGLRPVPVSVNLSPLHLQRANFLESFEEVRRRYGVASELLEFELTERLAFDSLELLRSVVDEIHERGFRCSMDDFGSGYSSLNVLKEIPVDVLKIDRQFFVGGDERAGRVVESVVDLADKLDMGTVAEGVETLVQVRFLKGIGCDAVQGYVFSKPVPFSEFERLAFGVQGESA